MKIDNLANIELKEIVGCLLKSFEGYFVSMPSDILYWQNRFKASRVDLALSFGVFENANLVGFILNGIDLDNNQKTAFNTGTGIIENYRGRQLVDRMYTYALPVLKENGICKCKLEVIDKNHRAIKVYERIGFAKARKVKCFNGELTPGPKTSVTLQEISLDAIGSMAGGTEYSWENTTKAISLVKYNYKVYKVVKPNTPDQNLGYFIINPTLGYIAQLESPSDSWPEVFEGIRQVSSKIKINNIDEQRVALLHQLKKEGLHNTIDQYEMEMEI